MTSIGRMPSPNDLKKGLRLILASVFSITGISLWLATHAISGGALFGVILTNLCLVLVYLRWSYKIFYRHFQTTSELEKKFQAVVNAAPDPMLVTSGDGKILWVSSQFKKCFGYRLEEAVGKNIEILIPDRFRANHPAQMNRYLQAPKVRPMGEGLELSAVRKDGTEFPVEISLSPLTTRNGTFIVSSIRDVTARKQAEQVLITKTQELAASNSALERFAFIASHDLQEPLRMVNSYLTLLEKQCHAVLDPNALEFLQFALDGGKRLKILIDDLLKFSRSENQRWERVPVDCNCVLRHVRQNLKLAMEEGNAKVSSHELPTVWGNPSALEQLFQNLIENAIKYRGQKLVEIEIDAKPHGRDWVFSVKDNGMGIAADDVNRIFDMFQRVHREELPGTGIGLATCKRIVERLGGRIWVESQPGSGSTFYFTLPFYRASSATCIFEPSRSAVGQPAPFTGFEEKG